MSEVDADFRELADLSMDAGDAALAAKRLLEQNPSLNPAVRITLQQLMRSNSNICSAVSALQAKTSQRMIDGKVLLKWLQGNTPAVLAFTEGAARELAIHIESRYRTMQAKKDASSSADETVLGNSEMTAERRAELAQVIAKMQAASSRFYEGAFHAGNHAFIEFCGLMNEYIGVCRQSLEAGIDFTNCNTHTGQLPIVHEFNRKYLREKLGCIFGGWDVVS